MRGRIAVAAVTAAVLVVPWSASGASPSPGARAAGCEQVFSVQVFGSGSWTQDPKGTWLDGNGSFCQVPQTIGATPAPITLSGVDVSTSGETTWNLASSTTAATVSFDNFEGWSTYCTVVGGSGYTCLVAKGVVSFRPSASDAVAPRVSSELLSRVPIERVVARGRLGVLVRTSEPASIRVSLVEARGGATLGAGRARAQAGGERVLVPVRLTAAGRRALSRARGFARYRLAIRAGDRAGNVLRRRAPVR
ncbi:MAG: hypothetical protein ACRDPL_18105, partial [Propionibacteriaceae bacterium]